MNKEAKKLVRLLEKAEVDKALEHAAKMQDKNLAAEILGDFAVPVAKNLYDYETAEQLLKTAASLNPKDAVTFFNLGVLYTEPGFFIRDENKFIEAEKAYIKAIKIRPDYLEAHYNLALFYHFLGRDDEAELEYAVFSKLCDDTEMADALKKILSKKIRKIDLKKYLGV